MLLGVRDVGLLENLLKVELFKTEFEMHVIHTNI